MSYIPHDHALIPSRSHIRSCTRRVVCLVVACLAACCIGFGRHVMAQSDTGPWTTPVNISMSGAASQPVIAAALDGRLHALWWDSAEGEQYAQTTTVTGTNWSKPVTLPQIYGKRKSETNQDTGKVTVTLIPPLELRMLSDLRGNMYAIWRDMDNQLSGAQTQGAGWGSATVLADSVTSIDAVTDPKGVVHLSYIRPSNSPGNPSGVYYRSTSGTGWSSPVLVYASLYFRTARPDQANVSVAGNGLGHVLITWDNPELEQSFYARSADGGRTWSMPQLTSDSLSNRVTRAWVALAPDGDFFLLWQDANVATCGLKLRRSTDGGQTWSVAERASTELSRCPGRWHFSLGGDSQMWLIGLPQSSGAEAPSNLVTLVSWNGRIWSPTADVGLSFQDTVSGKQVSLNSLELALADNQVGLIGTDGEGDVWVARNAVRLDHLISASPPPWQAPQAISDQVSPTQVKDVPALVADEHGTVYALWSESSDQAEPGAALYIAVWSGARWSRATRVFYSTSSTPALPGVGPSSALAEQPGLALDGEGRLHAVWRGGFGGEILYSWAFARDATSPQAWAEPVPLPAFGRPGSWPDIVADSRTGTLHTIYAVPYNEGRGIYYVRSNDGGTTWLTATVVFDAVAAKWDSVDKPRLALDTQTNVLYAVWLRTALIGEARGRAVMVARSTDGGRTWSAPVKVAEGVLDWPRLVTAGPGQACLVWNQVEGGSGPSFAFSEVWAQFTSDGGQRWTEPARVPGFEAVTGPVGLVAAGGLYLVGVGQGTGGEAALLYSRWDGQAWSTRQVSGLGQDAVSGNAAAAVLVPTAGRLVAALREFVRAPDSTGQFRLVATQRDLPVVFTPKPMPTFTPLPTLTPTATSVPVPTATARPSLNATGVPQRVNRGPLPVSTFLLAGGALIALLVVGVVMGQVAWATRR